MRFAVLFVFLLLAACAGKQTTTGGGVKEANVTIAYQSQRWGTIEPCGCQSRPWGGTDREFNALAKIRSERNTVFYFDSGNSLVTESVLKNPKGSMGRAQALVEMLNTNGLDAFVPGGFELSLGLDSLKKVAATAKFAWVATNLTDKKKEIFPPSTIITKNGFRLGVLGVVSSNLKLPAGIEIEAPVSAITRHLADLKGKSDLIVLLSQLTIGENEKLAEQFPDVAVVVSSDPAFSNDEPLWIKGRTLVVDTHIQGYMLGRLDLNLKLPLKGLYSKATVEKNRVQMAQWDAQLAKNPDNKIAAEMVKRMRAEDSFDEIPGGSEYSNKLVALDLKTYGDKNGVTDLIKKEKERVSTAARKE